MIVAVAATDAYSWAGAVGGVLGVVGLIGAAIAVLRSSISTNTIKLLKANNEALHEQNAQQQGEITTLKAKLEKQDERVEKQDQQIELLKEMVSGRKLLHELNDKVDQVLEALNGARP